MPTFRHKTPRVIIPGRVVITFRSPANVRAVIILITLLSSAASLAAGASAETDESIEEVLIYGRGTGQVGLSTSASHGFVGFEDIDQPPLLRVGELVETVPGMVATQHSGTGKANQYFLRGFNLDHGTDFSAHLNGMPLNMRTHGHGQGYLDLNPIIPELVETIEYQKGPYAIRKGDFSSAGSVDFSYRHALDSPAIKVSTGSYGFRRALLTLGNRNTVAAFDTTRYSGPWDIDEELKQTKGHVGWSIPTGDLTTQFHLDYYRSSWQASDQIPKRAVSQGVITPRGFIDPDLGGSSSRYSLNMTAIGDQFEGRLYGVASDFELFSNFTYLLENQDLGDEFEQVDQRSIWGGSLEGAHDISSAISISAGGEFRHDDIRQLGLYSTSSRHRWATTRDDEVKQTSVGGFAELNWQVNDRLRTNAGLRADYFSTDVRAASVENSGRASDLLISPKLNLAYLVSEMVELYVNVGRGMHSNDARGTVVSIDPNTGSPADSVPLLVPSTGLELGVRYELEDRLKLALTAFSIELDSELVFVGDGGSTEPNDGSRRRGFEAAFFFQASRTLQLDAAYTRTKASFAGVLDSVDGIPGAIETTLSSGISARWSDSVTTSFRVRYLGGAPLIEDRSVTSDSSLLANAAVSLKLERTEIKLEMLNVFDSGDADISYFYASRLPGEPASGITDVHYHPLEPRNVRLSIQYRL